MTLIWRHWPWFSAIYNEHHFTKILEALAQVSEKRLKFWNLEVTWKCHWFSWTHDYHCSNLPRVFMSTLRWPKSPKLNWTTIFRGVHHFSLSKNDHKKSTLKLFRGWFMAAQTKLRIMLCSKAWVGHRKAFVKTIFKQKKIWKRITIFFNE